MPHAEQTALINGRIHTPMGMAEALLIEAGRIAAIGTTATIGLRCDTKPIDLKGRSVFPGFSDSHAHFLAWAQSQEAVRLGDCRSTDDLRGILEAYADEHPAPLGGWYQGHGWNHVLMDNVMPTRHDLDAVVPDIPVYLRRVCGHVAVVNTAALKAAGITGNTRVEAGVIELGEDGEPNGILKENALDLIARCIPGLEDADLTRLLRKYGPQAAGYGLTEIHSDDLSMFGFDFRRSQEFFLDAARSGDLPFRLRRQLLLPNMDLLQGFLSEGWRSGDGIPMCQIGPLKLLSDGSLGGRTAFLREDYADSPGERGTALFEQGELDDLILTAHLSGMQVAVHAIGDGALDMCLNAFERAMKQRPMATRHLIVHAQTADDAQLDRMRDLRLGAAIQPCFVPSDRTMALERLGKARAEAGYRWRSMIRKGIVLSSGSDAPIESLRPMLGIHAAVTRTAPNGGPEDGWVPEERLSVAEAIGTYTWNGAWNGHNERRRGEIAPGRDADLVVLERDPFLAPARELVDIGVAMTLCGGRVTHAVPELA